MDKKKNKILMGCLALLLVMTVGYALFSENITINGTATAKGDFDLSYTCELITENNSNLGVSTEGISGTCTIDGQTITTTSTLNKPTAQACYKVKITNTGTIPAVLKTVDSDNTLSADFTSEGDMIYIDKSTMLGAYYDVCLTPDEINCRPTSSGVMGDQEAENSNFTLQPNESLLVVISHAWGDSDFLGLSQPVVSEEGATINYNITLGFEQVQAE